MPRVEPARHIGRTHRKTAAGQADEQTDQQEMPVLGGVLHQINRQHRAQHQTEQNNAAAITIGPNSQRHPHQRAGQHRHRHQNAELGLVQPQLLLHWNAHHAHHHPNHETDGESKSADDQHRILLICLGCHRFSLSGQTAGQSNSIFTPYCRREGKPIRQTWARARKNDLIEIVLLGGIRERNNTVEGESGETVRLCANASYSPDDIG